MDIKEDKPLISVIVPIYNVEKYIRKCLDSLKNQTMKEIEIICIDDGSTDNSGRIVDEYRKDDWPRFMVLHTENKGLSAARNRGIDEAEADWIMFVDSDDWVDTDFCRIPYEVAVEQDADLVIFGRCIIDVNGKIIIEKNKYFQIGIVNPETAIDIGRMTTWNKLYKKTLFDGIRYPEGRIFEDISTTPKLIYRAFRIFCIPEALYYHLLRNDSLSRSNTEKSNKDGFISSLECYNDLSSYGYPVERFRTVLWFYTIGYLVTTKTRDAVFQKAEIIADSIPYCRNGLPLKRRLMLIVWKKNRDVFDYICTFFKKI